MNAKLLALLATTVVLASCAAQQPGQQRPVSKAKAHVAPRVNYPPFVSESAATQAEEREIFASLPSLNQELGGHIFTGFFITHEEGLPQFKYVVDTVVWNALDDERKRALVKPGGKSSIRSGLNIASIIAEESACMTMTRVSCSTS